MDPKENTLLTLIFISLLAATPLMAHQTMGPEIPVSVLDNEQYQPHVAYNNLRDEYLVVWHNFWGGDCDVYGQRLDGEGNLLSWFAIATGGHDKGLPAVAYDDINDRYLVVWAYNYGGTATDWDIMGRLIPWNGPDAALTEFLIEGAAGSQLVPEVAFAHSQQEFMVVYYNNPGSGATNIAGRRVTLYGTFPDNSFVLASGATDRFNPDIAYNLARNEYLVTYDLANTDILATRLTAGGIILGAGEFGIAEWPDPESRPAVAACKGGADQYLVVWQSLKTGPQNDLYGRFVAGTGLVGDVVSFANTTSDQQAATVTCHTPLQEYLVAWEDEYANGALGIVGQRLMTDGRMGPLIQIRPPFSAEDNTQPAAAAGRDGGFLVVWEHDRPGTSYQDIHGRRIMAPFFANGFESGNLSAWSLVVTP